MEKYILFFFSYPCGQNFSYRQNLQQMKWDALQKKKNKYNFFKSTYSLHFVSSLKHDTNKNLLLEPTLLPKYPFQYLSLSAFSLGLSLTNREKTLAEEKNRKKSDVWGQKKENYTSWLFPKARLRKKAKTGGSIHVRWPVLA